MMSAIQNIDVSISHFINTVIPHNAFFDNIASFLSLQGNFVYIWLIIIALLFSFEEIRNKKFISYFIVSFSVTIVLANYLLKNIFERMRPIVDLHYSTPFLCPTDYGFPSGHASCSFASAVILSHFDKKRSYLYYGVAVLVSLSRIYLECHYFFDVVGGAIIGFAISKAVLTFDKSNIHKSAKSKKS